VEGKSFGSLGICNTDNETGKTPALSLFFGSKATHNSIEVNDGENYGRIYTETIFVCFCRFTCR
jgi:hypothetical protein